MMQARSLRVKAAPAAQASTSPTPWPASARQSWNWTLPVWPPGSGSMPMTCSQLFERIAAGSRFLAKSNDLLQEIVERFPERRIAQHAQVALGNPLTVEYKQLVPTDDGLELEIAPARPEEAAKLIEPALVERADEAAETFGHIRYRTLSERIARRLADAGAEAEAARTIDSAIETLEKRIPDDRPVKARVMGELKEARNALPAAKKAKPRARAKSKP